jgi:hypothetical protein
LSDLDHLIAEAEIGDEAKQFLESDLGKTILGMIAQEIKSANEEFRSVDATDAKAVQAIQNKVWRAESLVSWLNELFTNGEAALQAYAQQRDQ